MFAIKKLFFGIKTRAEYGNQETQDGHHIKTLVACTQEIKNKLIKVIAVIKNGAASMQNAIGFTQEI